MAIRIHKAKKIAKSYGFEYIGVAGSGHHVFRHKKIKDYQVRLGSSPKDREIALKNLKDRMNKLVKGKMMRHRGDSQNPRIRKGFL